MLRLTKCAARIWCLALHGYHPVTGPKSDKDTVHFYASFFHIPVIQNAITFDLVVLSDLLGTVFHATAAHIHFSHSSLSSRQKKTLPQKGLITSTIRRDSSPKPSERGGRYTGVRAHATLKTQPEVEFYPNGLACDPRVGLFLRQRLGVIKISLTAAATEFFLNFFLSWH